ncbi:adult-specific cuticular protein ACP-20-like [Pollicipes pollicipes]|uniref:adult-specific cuticular protein ACP-20-like n=1 Tax=Pollicipes pollicipes TaxID=41117 RepID=UPI001885255E|nr:adult-specific cuticular protein ACP-20-like [Pollicipes pollicipes]
MVMSLLFQVLFVFAVVLALATASDLRRYGGEQEEEEDSDHTPYQFSYSVDDEDTVFSQSEEGDDEGDVTGEYSVNLPDGRVQTVRYFGDNDDGYTAEVSYEGEAQYPEDQSYQKEEEEEAEKSIKRGE